MLIFAFVTSNEIQILISHLGIIYVSTCRCEELHLAVPVCQAVPSERNVTGRVFLCYESPLVTQADKFYEVIEKLINLYLTGIARKLLILTLNLLIGIVCSCIMEPILSLTALL